MTHCTYRSRVRVGHQTATGPVTPTCSWDRWGRAETERTALGEALVMRRRTRVRFPPPPPPPDAGEESAPQLARSRGHRGQRWPRLLVSPSGWSGAASGPATEALDFHWVPPSAERGRALLRCCGKCLVRSRSSV